MSAIGLIDANNFYTSVERAPRWICAMPMAASDDGALIEEVRTVTKVLLIAIRRRERSLIESHFGGTGHSYSQRIAIIGSTFVARRAGIQQASRATNVNNSVMA